MSHPTFFTPPEVAKQLRCKASKILAWIATGELVAVNIAARSNGARPRYRISQLSIDRFIAGRSTTGKSAAPRRRRQLEANFTEYL
jgi:Helix-turn-helix domain